NVVGNCRIASYKEANTMIVIVQDDRARVAVGGKGTECGVWRDAELSLVGLEIAILIDEVEACYQTRNPAAGQVCSGAVFLNRVVGASDFPRPSNLRGAQDEVRDSLL